MRKAWITFLLASVCHLLFAQTNVWNNKTAMPNPGQGRYLAAGFAIGTTIYVGTGLNGSTALADFWEYNTTNDTWTQKTAFAGGARYGAVGFAINGKGYIALGTDGLSALDDVWEFDPNGNAGAGSWIQKDSYDGGGRAGSFAFVVDNIAYVGTGQDENTNVLSDVWAYDPVANNWTNKASVPGVSRMYAAAFTIGNKGYMGTGLDSNDDPMATFFEYDPAENEWTQKADFGIGGIAGAVGFAMNDRGYIGRGGSDSFWQFNPNNNKWTKKANVSIVAYVNAVGFAAGSKGYLFSGYGIDESPDMFEYIPDPTLLDQTITFAALANREYDDADFDLTATASSSLAVTYESSDEEVATISGSTVTIVGVGTTTITATQAGNGTYDPAEAVERTLTITKATQTITFDALPQKAPGDAAFALTATASSGLPVSYSSSNPLAAQVDGTNLIVVGVGTSTITAYQLGNDHYEAATNDTQTFTVAKLDQTITFTALPAKTTSDAPFDLAATSSSALAVSYSSSNEAVATISGSTVTITGAGAATITASQLGNNRFNPATAVPRTLTVSAGAQTWSGDLPTTAGYKNDFILDLTLSSGLTYNLTSSDPSIAKVTPEGNQWKISPLALGSTTLTASHAGNANFAAAPTITSTLVVGKGVQTITVAPISPKKVGDPAFELFITTSSGLPVTLEAPTSGAALAIVNDNICYINSGGTTTITAHVPGTDLYLETTTTFNITVAKRDLAITFEPLKDRELGEPAFKLYGSTDAFLPVSYTSSNPGVATISGTQVTITGKGTTTITAYCLGDSRFKAAVPVQRTLTVGDPHTLTFAPISAKTLGDPDFTIEANSSAALPITFSSADPSIATISGTTVSIKGVGSTYIIASAGTGSYAKKTATQLLVVKNIEQTPAQQGQLWGVLLSAGPHGIGSVFKTNADGTGYAVVKDFTAEQAGTGPGGMVLASNGKIYGITRDGGTYNGGTLYEYDPATGSVITRKHFEKYSYLNTRLVPASNGKIYGAISSKLEGTVGNVLFEYDVETNSFTKKLVTVDLGMYSVSDLFLSSAGKLYCIAFTSTEPTTKAIFEIDLTTNTAIHRGEFAASYETSAVWPVEVNGKVYFTTRSLGINGKGELFEFDLATNTLAVKHSFGGDEGGAPVGMTLAPNGKLYGLTNNGAAYNVGGIFEYDVAASTLTHKHSFASYIGGRPSSPMSLGSNGKLYGVQDGEDLFEFDPNTGTYRGLLNFTDETGRTVHSPMVPIGNKMYGAAGLGGASRSGAIFEFDVTTYAINRKFDFDFAKNGAYPMGDLEQAGNGKIYGMTMMGGAHNGGIIFEIDPTNNTFTKRHDFDIQNNGYNVSGGMTLAPNGKFYGTRSDGGSFLFEFDPNTLTYQKLLPFTDGILPYGKPVLAEDGKMWGLTWAGGANYKGTLFEFDPENRVVNKKVDLIQEKGTYPLGSPTIATNGKIYGVTSTGGENDKGVLFEYDRTAGTYTVKHSFSTSSGESPFSRLVEVDSKLYGATPSGGTNNFGVIFEYDFTTGVYQKRFEFTSDMRPLGTLLHAINGKLYGMTAYGGDLSTPLGAGGTLFEFDLATNTLKKASDIGPATLIGGGAAYIALMQATNAYREDQTVTFETISDKLIGDEPFEATATSSADLKVTITAADDKVTITNNTNKITLVKEGRVTLTASQHGNARFNPADEVNQTFCINPAKPTISAAGQNVEQVTLTSSASSGNKWYLDGIVIAGATGATLAATAPGVYTVQVSMDDCVSEMSDEVPLIVTGDLLPRFELVVYPNPATDKLFVKLPGKEQQTVTLYYADGRLVQAYQTSGKLLEVDVRSFANGLYLVRVSEGNQFRSTLKFIKK